MATAGPPPEAKFYNIVARVEIGQKPIAFQPFLGRAGPADGGRRPSPPDGNAGESAKAVEEGASLRLYRGTGMCDQASVAADQNQQPENQYRHRLGGDPQSHQVIGVATVELATAGEGHDPGHQHAEKGRQRCHEKDGEQVYHSPHMMRSIRPAKPLLPVTVMKWRCAAAAQPA